MTAALPLDFIKYATIDGGTRGVLGETLVIKTPIVGFSVEINEPGRRCKLERDGTLRAFGTENTQDFIWDFGSCAVDTPAMVRASVAHDVFCWMTNEGLLPWACRAQADKYFREQLKQYGPGKGPVNTAFNFVRRWWCYVGVRSNSKFIAYWQRKPYNPGDSHE